MNVKSIERKGNEATVVVEIDKELMESGVNKAYMKARKSIQLPGFRKGKAPRKMIEAMYGAHVFYEDGLDEIFPEIYDFAIAKQDFSFQIAIRPFCHRGSPGHAGAVGLPTSRCRPIGWRRMSLPPTTISLP